MKIRDQPSLVECKALKSQLGGWKTTTINLWNATSNYHKKYKPINWTMIKLSDPSKKHIKP